MSLLTHPCLFVWLIFGLIPCIVCVTIEDMEPVTATCNTHEVILPCVYTTSTPGREFSEQWTFGDMDGSPVIGKDYSGNLIVDQKYKGRVGFMNKSSSLVLRDPRESDNGNYTCLVVIPSDPHPVDSKTVHLSVMNKLKCSSSGESSIPVALYISFSIIAVLIGVYIVWCIAGRRTNAFSKVHVKVDNPEDPIIDFRKHSHNKKTKI